MMGSRIAGENKSSAEKDLEECRTLPASHYRQKCRKNKSSFKSPVSSKRFKTLPEITNSANNEKMPIENTAEEEENKPRRSKRKRNCDSNVQMGETASTDVRDNLKSDAKETKDENIYQNSNNFNLIPENVIRTLDKELFSEEADEKQDLKYTEDMSKENKIVIFIKETNSSITPKVDDDTIQQAVTLNDKKTETRKVEHDMQYQADVPQTFSKITENNEINEKETDVKEKKVEKNCTEDITDKIILDTLEHNEKCERNNNTQCITNEKVINDPNLDLLYANIEKADDIINSLVNAEKCCSANRHSILSTNSKKASCLSENFVDESFYAEQDKNVSGINLAENCNTLDENSSEIMTLTPRKNWKTFDENQNNLIGDKSYMKNKQSEESCEASGCSENLATKEGNIEEKHNLSDNKDSNHFDASSEIDENRNKKRKMLHEYDSTEEFNNQTSSKSETNVFSTENDDSHEKYDLDNSHNSATPIQNSHAIINNCEDVMNGKKNLTENLEMKPKKLTLLYMNALDYEKENKKNDSEIMEKSNEIKDKNFQSDAEDECIDNASVIQKNKTKQDLNEFLNEMNEQNTKVTLELQIHQNINEKKMFDEKEELKEDTQENSVEMKTNINDFERENTNQIIYETAINEKQHSKNQDPIKYDLTCCKEMNRNLYDFQEHFTTLQFHDKSISLSQTSSNVSIYSNEAKAEAVNSENEDAEKCYRIKCIPEPDNTFIVTDNECFKSEQNENLTGIIEENTKEKPKHLKEDITSYEDVEGSFDMDDDFDLTASQINMIETNENNQYKEAKSHLKIEKCSNTHFGQDSLTVEIMDQLCYIKESVDSVKELLKTFLMKNEEKK